MHAKKLYIIFLLSISISMASPAKAMLENSIKFCNYNDIALAKSLLATNYIKNIYLYAPKSDSLRILIRTLWHIFYGQEHDQLIPTKKGPLSVITPEFFEALVNYSPINNLPVNNSPVNNLPINEHNLVELYAKYLPQEIHDIKNILNYLEQEAKTVSQKILDIDKNIACAENKKLELTKLFEINLISLKAEKDKKLQDINKKFTKKSQERSSALKEALQPIDKKYDINNFKKLRENINIELSKLKEERLEIIREQKNTLDELKNKNLELAHKVNTFNDPKLIELEVANAISDLMSKIKLASTSQLHAPKIAYAVLWAYYISKFNTQEDFAPHQFPQEVKMGRFVCELSQGKISDKFSDCLECSVLDLISILLYNPISKQYDPTIIQQNLRSGTGYKKLIKALKYAYTAHKNKIKELDYSLQIRQINFTSLKKLKAILQESGINKEEVNATKLGDINSSFITSSLVRQKWINIVSGLDNIKYNQEDKKCEILPLVENIINLLNLFYGTNANKIEDFGPILSFYNPDTKTKREISFELLECKSNNSRPEIIIKINHEAKYKPNLTFLIKITLMKHHTVLEFKEREQNKSVEFEKIPANLDLKEVRLAYFSQNIKDSKIKLAITKHALKNSLLQYPDIKKLIFKLKDKLSKDIQLEYKLIKYIIIYGAYKDYPELKEYITKRATQTLGVICQANLDICKQEFYELQKYLIQNNASINAKCEPNSDTLLIKTIKAKYLDLVNILLKNTELDINKTGENKQTALHAAAILGNLEVIQKLLDNKNMNTSTANALDNKNNTPLNLAIENNKFEAVKLMLEHPKIIIPTLKTPLHSACARNNENMLKFLLTNTKTNNLAPDFNNNMPMHVAAFYGHTNLVGILSSLPDTDINVKGYKNRTALNLAAKNNKLSVVCWLLKQQNINPNIQDSGNYTPLNRAVKNNFPKITKILLEHEETDINLADRWGYSPLFWATKIEVLRELLKYQNLNINHQDLRMKTALYWASAKCWTPIATSLLSHKDINPDIANFLGKTPISVARTKKHTDIVKLIENHKKNNSHINYI